jgi:nitroimidazol reductase NimA-like FMN-containing flavoprotein (pyridoxamine 5'-phosphate oxidase superfamily)
MAEHDLTAEEEAALRTLWDEKALARVATVTAAGEPHVVPIWWELRDGRVRMVTYKTSKKVRNLEGSRQIAVTIDVDRMPYHGVRLTGSARQTADAMAESIERMSVHFWGEEQGLPFAKEWIATAADTSTVIEVVPESVVVFREEG